ncbi:uncharacterized protein LOC117340471 [Pecten maximus]|uniref:uncharacterized protein LOC117340471 n=1 Tax=Pecten maximus TaxID=6579 RepID=UPI001458B5AC|nr:uncharacterized protein LOC117340471 [Pecten maximus]
MAAQMPVPGCTRHPGMGFLYVCKSCEDELLCMECVTDSHNGHTLGKLTDYVADQKREIQQYVDKLSKTDIPKIEEDIHESETNGEEYQKVISDIKRQGKKLKDNIDNAIDFLMRICTELETLNASISEENKIALTKHLREDLKPKLDRCQEVLTSGTTVDVTTLAQEIRNSSTASPSIGTLQTVEFKPGIISTELLERMLGRILVGGEDQSCKLILKPVTLNEFTTSFYYDSCRTCKDTGSEAWVTYSDNVFRMSLDGTVKEKIECKVGVTSISVSPTTGRVWFCVRTDRSIRESNIDGEIVIQFNVTKTPFSLCVNSDDMVVVGTAGEIQLYTTDGQALSAGAGGPCRQVAVLPRHMTSCPQTGDVAAVDTKGYNYYIADKEPETQPCVIVMDKHLNLKFSCIGITTPNVSSNQLSKFYPCDVCFDAAGDVLVADAVTKSVLLIDGNTGRCMRTVYTCDECVPKCISLHEDGTFWIGHKDTTIKVLQYK